MNQLKSKLDLDLQHYADKLKEDGEAQKKLLKVKHEKEIEEFKSTLSNALLKDKGEIQKQNELEKKSLIDNLSKKKTEVKISFN